MLNGNARPFTEAKGGTILAYPVDGTVATVTRLGRTWKIVASGKNLIRKDSPAPKVFWELPQLPTDVELDAIAPAAE